MQPSALPQNITRGRFGEVYLLLYPLETTPVSRSELFENNIYIIDQWPVTHRTTKEISDVGTPPTS